VALTEWESAAHFVALFAATALLDGERPQSLLLVGPPAEGKTALLRRFAHWPGVCRASDVTVSGLRDTMHADHAVRVLMLDEFQRLFGHQAATVENVTGLLLSLMSGDGGRELVGPDHAGQRVDLTGRALGIMTAIPFQVLRFKLRDMAGSGLLSRFAFLSLQRSAVERARVRRNIIYRQLGDLAEYPAPQLPGGVARVAVQGNKAADAELERWLSGSGFNGDSRGVHLLTVLLRAVALLDGRDRVKRSDVGELRAFAGHLSSLAFDVGAVTPREVPPLQRAPVWARAWSRE
jgi:hypothetical protein